MSMIQEIKNAQTSRDTAPLSSYSKIKVSNRLYNESFLIKFSFAGVKR